MVCDTSLLLNRALEQGQTVLFEGAQATMLDVDHGTYPFVTSSTTLAAGGVTYPTPQRVKVGNAIAWDTAGNWSLVLSRLGSDGADTLATAIFLQGIAIRQAGT